MQYSVYLTVYLGNDIPKFYLGSSSNSKLEKGYKGSVLSKEYKNIWKHKVKHNPELFKVFIIASFNTRKEAYYKEMKLQKMLHVIDNPLYLNRSYANGSGRFGGGFKGKKHSESHKKYISSMLKGRPNTWTPKHRPEHSNLMKGNKNAKGNKNPEQSLKMKNNTICKNLYWWNNGITNKRSVTCPSPEYSSGRLPFKKV